MSVLLGLFAAVAFGTSDFFGGLASRRVPAAIAAVVALLVCLVMGALGVVFYPGDGLGEKALLWGLASGIGMAVASLALYRGLGSGEMSVVATLSGLLNAVVPVAVGLATGDDNRESGAIWGVSPALREPSS
jgi:uncharacterized membrane protein